VPDRPGWSTGASPQTGIEIGEERVATGSFVIALAGRVDSNTSGTLEKRLLARLAGGESRLVLDLSGVQYMSSAGLRVLLLASNRCQAAGGRLVLCSLRESVREVFDLAGFTALFPIEASRDLALHRATL
jgi:anti-sigma B factor antagonist